MPPQMAVMPTLRRRRRDQSPREKTSLSLRADVLEAAREIVKAGDVENLSAFVESALEEKLRRAKRAALYAAYEEAAMDDQFMARMSSVTRSFAGTEEDGL